MCSDTGPILNPGVVDSYENGYGSYNVPEASWGTKTDDANDVWLIKDGGDKYIEHRPGLTGDAGTVSFESVKKPGHYLRHRNHKMYTETGDSELWRKDGTFYERKNKWFDGYSAYEAFAPSNNFIRHHNWRMKLSGAGNNPNDVFKKDASFKMA